MQVRCGSLSITKLVSLLSNEFDVRSVLHGQVNLAAVNHIYVFHEVMNSCENLKIHKRLALKMELIKHEHSCKILYIHAKGSQMNRKRSFLRH